MNLNTISLLLVGKANKANEGKKEITCTLFPNEAKERKRKGKGREGKKEGKEVMRFFRCLLHTQRGSQTDQTNAIRESPLSLPLSPLVGCDRQREINALLLQSLHPTIIAAIVVVSRTASKELALDALFCLDPDPADYRSSFRLFVLFGNAFVLVSLGCLLLLFFFFFFFSSSFFAPFAFGSVDRIQRLSLF
jgi:hypothetical protein